MSEDTRASTRIPFSCRAQLLLLGHAVLNCRVVDVCTDGFYLSDISELPRLTVDPFNPLVEGAAIEILVLPFESADESFRFRCQVARIEQTSMGVVLNTPRSENILALLALAKDSGGEGVSHSLKAPQTNLIVRRSLVENLKGPLAQTLDSMLDHFFDLAADKLLALASRATNNNRQAQYFDLITELRTRKGIISQRYRRPMLEAWAAFADADVVVRAVKESYAENELSMVDKDEFEDWLTINTVVSNAEEQYRQQIECLQGRLGVMAGREIDAHHNPLSPDFIYGSLHEAAQILNVSSQLQQELYKIFEIAALPRLGDLYAVFNAQLKMSGILPDIETRRKKTRVHNSKIPPAPRSPAPPAVAPEVSPRRAVSDAAGLGSPEVAETPLNQRQVSTPTPTPAPTPAPTSAQTVRQLAPLKSVQDLLAWKRTSSMQNERSKDETSTASAPPENNLPSWSEDQLMDALSEVQGSLKNQENAESVASLRSQLTSVQTDHDGELSHQFSGVQQDYIEIVDSLFDSLMEDQSIPDEVKPWLRAQQVPLLKVLVQDPAFFSDATHPARQFLNKMANLVSSPRGSVETMQKTLHGYCDKILHEYDGDAAVYEEVNVELSKMEQKQHQAITRNTQRLVSTYDGQQRLQAAKRDVGCEIDLRIGGSLVPQVVLDLFDVGLRDILVLTYVREGVGSDTWNDQWLLVDQMLGELGIRRYRKGVPELRHPLDVDLFLKSMARYLDTPAVEAYLCKDVLAALQALLLEDPGQRNTVNWVEVPTISEAKYFEKPVRRVEIELQRWRRRAKKLKVGDWLAQIKREDHEEAINLAWIGENFSSFVFVNKQGLKAIEYDLDEMAQAMSEGLLPTEAEEESMLDKGMFNIVQNVYRDMAYQTSHDQLTGLLSRKAFERQLHFKVEQMYGGKSTHSLCYIDVDFFKAINSNCGTEAGDQLLQEIAQTLTSCDIPILMSGRVGGNEFAIVLENIGLPDALVCAEKLRSSVEEMNFFWEREKLAQTVSVGVCEINADIESSIDSIKQATSACQQAKDKGRNQVVAFQKTGKSTEKRDDMGMLAFIQQALDDKLLGLRCQRIKYIGKDSSAGHYEVLLTVRDQNEQNVPLDLFITTAEKHNRMQTIDRWVISNILEWIAANPRQAKKMESYSINLSGNSLNDDNLMDFILEWFAKTGVSPEIICFEITETATIDNITKTADFIREMKKHGCRFSLDDFGTGLSSFAYLKQLPVDYLKIDGAFIRDIAKSSVDYAMVKSIKEVAHLMGMQVVAEYVENEEIIRCLREIGIDFAQGYAIEYPKALSHYQKHLH